MNVVVSKREYYLAVLKSVLATCVSVLLLLVLYELGESIFFDVETNEFLEEEHTRYNSFAIGNIFNSKRSVFRPDAPQHAVNPSGYNFDATDLNNPTKLRTPPDGFPPRNLPKNHRSRELLLSLRNSTYLKPRWPDHPELHVTRLKSYGPAYASIIISHKLKLVYVPVFKVGTTSMMYNIAFMENMKEILDDKNLNEKGRQNYLLHDFSSGIWKNHTVYTQSDDDVRAAFNDPSYLKFAFVRNPYSRIASAYMDKIVEAELWSWDYKVQLQALYGSNPHILERRKTEKPSFIQYVHDIENVLSQPRTPTSDLYEDTAYETNATPRDVHWRPQTELLHPDLIHFDFIGKIEHPDRDRTRILSWMNQFTDRRLPKHVHHLHKSHPLGKAEIYNIIRTHKGLKHRIMRIYKEDFKHFGYSTEVPAE